VSRGCLQIQRTDGQWYWAEYSTFSISDEVGKYQLTVDGYRGDAGDAVTEPAVPVHMSNGQMFSTLDSDNDVNVNENCATNQGGGWWYGNCAKSELNKDDNGHWSFDLTNDVQASRMLVKLN